MTTYRLKENHPLMIAFDELCEKADELGVRLEFLGHRTIVYFNGKEYDLEDIEYPYQANTVNSFPPVTEFKLTYEKETK